MRRPIQIALTVLALAAVPALGGCESMRSKPGPDGTAFSLCTLDGLLNASPQKVIQASENVMKEQEFHIASSDATGVDGKIVAHTALDKEIAITVKRESDTSSKISIRVGSFGDQAMSRDLYEKIKAKLQ